MDEITIGRRMLMQGLGLATAGVLAPGAGPACAAEPVSAALAYRKLAWSADEALTFSWLRGTRYGLSEGVLYPFWQMYVGTIFAARDLPDGGYEVTTLSKSFYGDLATGEPIKQALNPITGKTVEIVSRPPSPRKLTFNGALAPTVSEPRIAWIESGEVCVKSDFAFHEERPVNPTHINDLTLYTGKVSDVADPRVKNPPATSSFNDLNSWPAWLGMDGREGASISRASGRKVFRYSDMPVFWREQLERDYPAIARDPVGALRG